MVTQPTLADLGRDPGDVARGLVAWQRGDRDEAVLQTLRFSAHEMSRSAYTLWAWEGHTAGAEPAWLLAIRAAEAAAFSPRGPARALVRCIEAALTLDADPDAIRLEDWRGQVCLVAPGMAEGLAGEALDEAHPPPGRARAAMLPAEVVAGGTPIPLVAQAAPRGEGLLALGRTLGMHPLTATLTLARHGLPTSDVPSHPGALVAALEELGYSRAVDRAPAPSLLIDDDPCPRRRHARRVLRRLLQKGKIGGYHTEFDHFTRGLPDHEKNDAKEIAEALLRAGLLAEKPSVGQRHISLRREALPDIHALIERGETRDRALAAVWTAPAPGSSG